MSRADPYRGRRHQAKQIKEQLRESSKQDAKPQPGRGGIGDVRSAHLTGLGGPYSSAHKPK